MKIGPIDAHLHLTDECLRDALPGILKSYDEIHLQHALLVGTSPEDWPRVLELCARDERFIPAVGLHPWKVNHATENWQDSMLEHLDQGAVAIGEIGLDQWVEDYDLEKQEEAFRWQMSLAAERNLPTSIHCLKAHEPMLKMLRSIHLPDRGFKLHAYNGPVDTLKPFLELGAYFSFNAGQLKPNAKVAPELIKQVPEDRILVETDAPNFQPHDSLREFELDDKELCHPGNIRSAYREIAKLRGCPEEAFGRRVAENFQRYFLKA